MKLSLSSLIRPLWAVFSVSYYNSKHVENQFVIIELGLLPANEFWLKGARSREKWMKRCFFFFLFLHPGRARDLRKTLRLYFFCSISPLQQLYIIKFGIKTTSNYTMKPRRTFSPLLKWHLLWAEIDARWCSKWICFSLIITLSICAMSISNQLYAGKIGKQ